MRDAYRTPRHHRHLRCSHGAFGPSAAGRRLAQSVSRRRGAVNEPSTPVFAGGSMINLVSIVTPVTISPEFRHG